MQKETSPAVWLILSYRANIPGSACSQHIDDRLPHLVNQGISPVLLSGPIGERNTSLTNFRTFSIAPSGIRFELRHFLRKRLPRRWQFKLAETLLLLPVMPLYLLEKVIINLESEWSWFFITALRGLVLCRKYRPTVIYSTGGSASAHVAALIMHRCTGLLWLAETQDPLVHDQGWRRGKRVKWLYRWLEKEIFESAHHFIFLDENARIHAAARAKSTKQGFTLYPGSDPGLFHFQAVPFHPSPVCRFSHFGTLCGTRNLVVFFEALADFLSTAPDFREKVHVDVYGSFDQLSQEAMAALQLRDLISYHGTQLRRKALQAMQASGVLLLVQNVIYFSCETTPSKMYEYLLSGRPIVGLVHNNEHLARILIEEGHSVAEASSRGQVADVIQTIVTRYFRGDFDTSKPSSRFTIANAVRALIRLSSTQDSNLATEKSPS